MMPAPIHRTEAVPGETPPQLARTPVPRTYPRKDLRARERRTPVRVLLVAALSLLLACASAVEPPASAAVYAGPSLESPELWLELELRRNGEVRGALRGPATGVSPSGEEPLARLSRGGADFRATAELGGALRLRARAQAAREEHRGSDEAGDATILVTAALTEQDELDPFGSATVALSRPGDEPLRVELAAIGTSFTGRAALADGTFLVERRAPFLYEAPWAELGLVGSVAGEVEETLRQGLAQRRDLPRGVAGRWTDERVVRVRAFGPSLVSVLYERYTYTGGAHPNMHVASETLLRDDAGWRSATLCEVLRHLDHGCDPDVVRGRVVRELREQEAAWVVQGEVTAATEWLLETFSVDAHGLRFDFSPYQVGPYAQGPHVVRVPWRALREQ